MTKPIQINRPKPFLLSAKWSDGFSATISLEEFRKACPCAECTGERIGEVIYSRPKPVKFEPGAFELTDLKAVGNYAICAFWKNGHDTGLYSWDLFRKIFEENNLSQDGQEKISKKLGNDKRNISFKILNSIK